MLEMLIFTISAFTGLIGITALCKAIAYKLPCNFKTGR